MPSNTSHLVRFLRRNRALQAEIAQYFRDVRYWNATNPQHEPIDSDPDGELQRQLAELERAEAELVARIERERELEGRDDQGL